MVWFLSSKLRRENFNAAIMIQFNGFRVSCVTLEPRLGRAFFFFLTKGGQTTQQGVGSSGLSGRLERSKDVLRGREDAWVSSTGQSSDAGV